MPELTELRIMSDYINRVSTDKNFYKIRKSAVSKVKCSLGNPFGNYINFSVFAESRGKELRIKIKTRDIYDPPKEGHIMFMMGMSGNWNWTKTGEEAKHTHFMIDTKDGYTLGLVDPRRFAKWKWGTWGEDRSPCPVKQHEKFKKNIMMNINHHKDFEKPIYEFLLNQKFCNGIGNYLRAEILDRINYNPNVSAAEFIIKNPEVLNLCKIIPDEVYRLGGGELKDWVNPNNEKPKEDFKSWLKCYGKKSHIIDSTKRKFWLDKKWIKYENNL